MHHLKRMLLIIGIPETSCRQNIGIVTRNADIATVRHEAGVIGYFRVCPLINCSLKAGNSNNFYSNFQSRHIRDLVPVGRNSIIQKTRSSRQTRGLASLMSASPAAWLCAVQDVTMPIWGRWRDSLTRWGSQPPPTRREAGQTNSPARFIKLVSSDTRLQATLLVLWFA